MYGIHLCCSDSKQPYLKLKTRSICVASPKVAKASKIRVAVTGIIVLTFANGNTALDSKSHHAKEVKAYEIGLEVQVGEDSLSVGLPLFILSQMHQVFS
jgi:hypothetical protein